MEQVVGVIDVMMPEAVVIMTGRAAEDDWVTIFSYMIQPLTEQMQLARKSFGERARKLALQSSGNYSLWILVPIKIIGISTCWLLELLR